MIDLFYAAAFVYGLINGSFLNVCIFRIPAGASIVWRSRCPGCGTAIRPYDLVPVLSFIILRGRCRHCGRPISHQYPLVELLTGICFLAVAIKYGIALDTLKYWIFTSLLIVVAFIDLKTMLIPNRLVVAGIITSLFFIRSHNWEEALAGGAVCFVTMLTLYIISRGGLGEGDVKLALVIGLYLGWPLSVEALALSALVGGVVGVVLLATGIKKRNDPVPFGPSMSAAAIFTGVYGWNILNWYMGGVN